VEPASLASRSRKLLATSRRAAAFPYLIAMLVAAALALALFGAAELARLAVPVSADAARWPPPLPGLLHPPLLAMLGAVALLSLLALWVIVRYERRLELLAESRARNRAIVDNMLDGAIHIDARGRIAGINAAAERLFGYRSAELKGQPMSLLFAAPLRAQLEAAMREYPELGLPPSLVGRQAIEGQRRDGTTLPLSLAVTEVHVGGYLVYTAIVRQIDGSHERKREPSHDLVQ
jgi:PAS domain S-box-containing protein